MLKLFKHNKQDMPISQILIWMWNVMKRHTTQMSLNVILGCMFVMLDFAFIAATKYTIDIATHKINGSIHYGAIILGALLTSQIIIGYASKWIKAILGVRARNAMQQNLFRKLLYSDWNSMNKWHSGDLLNRAERDVTDVVNTVTEIIPGMITVCVRLIGAFIFLYHMDSTLACIAIFITPVFMAVSRIYVSKMRKLTREVRKSDSKIQSILQESLQHRMVIQTLEQQDTMISRLSGMHNTLHKQIKQRTVFSASSSSIVTTGFSAGFLFTFVWGAFHLYEGNITYGMMLAFIQLVGQIQSPFRDMSRYIPTFVNTFTACERLIELERIPKETENKGIHMEPTPGVRFRNVAYRYEKDKRWILESFTHDFTPGSRTAIIGETGAGKTTLIRLMLSLIHPEKGEITLYNEKESLECTSSLRCNFVYVPQGNTLFSGTIRENLLLGNPEADEEEMKEALKNACAEFVFDLPEALDSPCSEQGGGLSEGQAQRIAVARALLRKGGILLLDEVTSALDEDTEKKLWSNLSEHCKDKTLIFITHRKQIIDGNTVVVKLIKNK